MPAPSFVLPTTVSNPNLYATKVGLETGINTALSLLYNDLSTQLATAALGLFPKGDWSPAGGVFPAGAVRGDYFTATTAGTVSGKAFAVGDWLAATVNAPSTTIYAANWTNLTPLPAPPQTFTSIAALQANLNPLVSVVYTVSAGLLFRQYNWVAGSTEPQDNAAWTVVAPTAGGGRYIAVADAAIKKRVLSMGQSEAVGADPGTLGSAFTANSRVKVYRASLGALATPTAGVEPFNASGCNNIGIQFCNKLAETEGVQVEYTLIAQGSTPISAWVGTPANRTVSVGNRPKWVDLQTACAAIGSVFDIFHWTQGVANGNPGSADYLTPAQYAVEFEYLLSQMTAAGYITAATAVLVSQVYLGNDRHGDRAANSGFNANLNLRNLMTLGDPRIVLVSSKGLTAPLEVESSTAAVHFDDASMTILGRRMYPAYLTYQEGTQYPVDIALESQRLNGGKIGTHFHQTETTVPISTTYTATKEDLGGVIWLNNLAILELPDFTSTKYSSRFRNGGEGLTIFFSPRQAGSVTVRMATESPAGTGLVQGLGVIYAAGASTITISAATNALVKNLYAAIWSGSVWEIHKVSN